MCLYKSEMGTDFFREKNTGKKEVVVWKLYRVNSNNKLSPLYAGRYGKDIAIPRTQINIVSDRKKIKNDYFDTFMWEINRGIHVFTSREAARNYKRQYFPCAKRVRVFRCTAQMKDFVGANTGQQAVFMKVRLSEEDFDKGVKGRN